MEMAGRQIVRHHRWIQQISQQFLSTKELTDMRSLTNILTTHTPILDLTETRMAFILTRTSTLMRYSILITSCIFPPDESLAIEPFPISRPAYRIAPGLSATIWPGGAR